MGSDGAASFGIGMMASGGYQAVAGAMNGGKRGFEGVKERMQAFKEEFKRNCSSIKSSNQKPKKKKQPTVWEKYNILLYPTGKELEGR